MGKANHHARPRPPVPHQLKRVSVAGLLHYYRRALGDYLTDALSSKASAFISSSALLLKARPPLTPMEQRKIPKAHRKRVEVDLSVDDMTGRLESELAGRRRIAASMNSAAAREVPGQPTTGSSTSRDVPAPAGL
jgi:hypothetical protein